MGDLHFLRVANARNQVARLLDHLVSNLVIRLEQHFDLGVFGLLTPDVLRLVRQVHLRQVVVGLEQLLNGLADQARLLLKGADLLGQHQQDAQLLAVHVLLQVAEQQHDGLLHGAELLPQLRRDRHEHDLERAELVRQAAAGAVGRLLLAQLALQLVHELGLGRRARRAVHVEEQHAVVLDQHAQVQQVEQDGLLAHEHVREVGRVDLAQVAGHEAVL